MMGAGNFLNEKDAVRLLLVRAVEEGKLDVFSKEAKSKANSQAFEEQTELAALNKWAKCLFSIALEPLLALNSAVLGWMRPLVLAVIILGPILGMASNFLGSSSQVHIVRNPIVFLILWNLLVYFVLFLLWVSRWSRNSRADPSSALDPGTKGQSLHSSEPAEHILSQVPRCAPTVQRGHNWLARRLLRRAIGPIWEKWLAWRVFVDLKKDEAGKWAETFSSFITDYAKAMAQVIDVRLHYLFHLGAIGLVVGAIAGTYLRGLFFEYNVVWKSTFIHSPDAIAAFLNAVAGMASLALDGRFVTAADVEPLLQGNGTLAASWIHKLALSAMLLVVLPRAVLFLTDARRAWYRSNHIEIDLSNFAEIIKTMCEEQIRLRGDFTPTIRQHVAKLAQKIADLVRWRFFDELICPALTKFRQNGGRIKDLESEIEDKRSRFEPELAAGLARAQLEFAESLCSAVTDTVGRQVSAIMLGTSADVKKTMPQAGQQLTGTVATGLSDTIGVAVTGAVTVTVATISGGIGHTLGVAILSTLLGTSGPIGLLLGGVGALVIVGGGYILGRDRLAGAMRNRKIPAIVAALALSDSKLEMTRRKIYMEVKTQIEQQFEGVIPAINEEIRRGVLGAFGNRR
jgi:hypothetical protein